MDTLTCFVAVSIAFPIVESGFRSGLATTGTSTSNSSNSGLIFISILDIEHFLPFHVQNFSNLDGSYSSTLRLLNQLLSFGRLRIMIKA